MNVGKRSGLDDSYSSGSADDNRRVYRNWAETYDEEFAERGGYQFGKLIARPLSTQAEVAPC